MFKIGNFLFRREIIHYTNWQNLCRDKYPKAQGWQNLCREESRQREAGRTSAGRNTDGAELAEPLPGRIQTARSWQNLCREESGRRGAGRGSAGRNPDSAGLAEALPGGIPTARSWQNLCREESGRREAGRISAGRNQDSAGLAESLPGRINVGSDRHGVCPYMRGRINVGIGRTANHPLGGLSAPSQSGKNNLTLYDMLIGIKLVENVKHICRKIDHCTVDKLIRYLVISLSNSPGYTGFSIGVAVAKHSYSDCVFKRV